jgi:hypothetical protein
MAPAGAMTRVLDDLAGAGVHLHRTVYGGRRARRAAWG